MKSIVLFFSIFIFSFAGTLTLVDKNNLNIAKSDFVNANYKKSYEKLKKLFFNNPSNYEINYHLAKAAVKIKKFGMASAAYERILINEPNNLEIKVEQAKLLYLTGNVDASVISLKKLLSENLSTNLNKSVKSYLNHIQDNKNLFSLEATFLLSANYNNNVNNAGDDKYILQNFDYLGEQGRDKVSDSNHLEYINIDISKELEGNESVSFKNNFSYFTKTYRNEKSENIEFYSYKPGLEIKDNSKLYYVGTIFERYHPGYKSSEDYFDSVGIETIFYNKVYLLDLKAQRFFFRDVDSKDKNYTRYQTGFRTSNKYGFNFSTNLAKDIVFKSTRTDINKIFFDNTLIYTLKLSESIVLEPSIRYKMTNYKDTSIAFNTRRKDKLGKFALELKKYINTSSFISLQTSYLNNESNQEEYDYKSKTIGLVYVKKFNW